MKGKRKRTEILCRFRDKIVVELNDDPACWGTCDRDIKEGDLSFAHFPIAFSSCAQQEIPLNKKYTEYYVIPIPRRFAGAESAEFI